MRICFWHSYYNEKVPDKNLKHEAKENTANNSGIQETVKKFNLIWSFANALSFTNIKYIFRLRFDD